MHADIATNQRHIFALYQRQREFLATQPRAYVEELLHRSQDLLHASEFSVRTAAEISRTACLMVLHLEQHQPKEQKL